MRGRQLLKAIVSICLLGWILTTIDFQKAVALLRSVDATCFLTVLALALVGILMSAWKWAWLLKALGVAASFHNLLRLIWVGAFFNNFLPGRTGGDVVRAYGVARNAQNRLRAASSVVIDRGVNLAAMAGIALVSLAAGPASMSGLRVWLIPSVVGVCVLALLVLMLGPRLLGRTGSPSPTRRILEEVWQLGSDLVKRPRMLLVALLLGVAYQVTVIASNYAIARGLGLDIAPSVFFCLIPVTALITMLPISLNGLGVREGAYAVLFSQVGVAPEAAVAVSITATVCMIGVSAVGGVLYISSPVPMDATPTDPEPRCSRRDPVTIGLKPRNGIA